MKDDVVATDLAHKESCPICSRELKKPHKCKTLYGVKVCKKCRNGFASCRQFAYLIDVVLWVAIVASGAYLFEWMVQNSSPSMWAGQPSADEELFLRVAYIAWNWLILPTVFCMKDGFGGKSPGKALLGARVIDVETREPIGFLRSLKRNLVHLIPYIGFVGIVLTMMKGKRWGDGWAKTQVVWAKYDYKVPFDLRGILCTTCGYNLTGNLSGRCPECGTEFDSHRETPGSV